MIDLASFSPQFSTGLESFSLSYKTILITISLHLDELISKKKNNCNVIITRSIDHRSHIIKSQSLFIKKKLYSYFYSKILYTSILTITSVAISMITSHCHYSCTNLDIISHTLAIACSEIEILCILQSCYLIASLWKKTSCKSTLFQIQ